MTAPFIVKPTAKHTATIIFLHGLGDNGHGWSENFEEIKEPYIKYVFPNAPVMPVTLNGGFRMPSWFDLYSLSPSGKEDEAGIKNAVEKLQALIAEEEKHVPSKRIIVGGFSQGGALAMYTALTMEKSLAGLLVLSSWLPLHKSFPQAVKWNPETPALHCHGEADPVVPFSFGQLSSDLIKSFPTPNYQFKSYPGLPHSSSLQEMTDIKQWIKEILPSTD